MRTVEAEQCFRDTQTSYFADMWHICIAMNTSFGNRRAAQINGTQNATRNQHSTRGGNNTLTGFQQPTAIYDQFGASHVSVLYDDQP